MASIKVGDTFLIHVNIKKAKKVFGFTTFLNFPVDAIEIVQKDDKPDITKGIFLGNNATMIANLSLNTANNVGTLIAGYSLKGGATEKSGEGLMFSIRARAIKEGDHHFTWSENSAVKDSNLVDQPKSFEDFTMKIEKDAPNVNIISITVEKES